MGKGSSILATIALIIGLGVGTFVIYDNFFVVSPDIPPENQWYDFHSGSYLVPASESWGTLSVISIDFDVSSGQAVHFLFIGQINFDDSSTLGSYVEVRFKIDGIIFFFPRIYVMRYNTVTPGGLRMSVSLQHYNTTMTSGTHSIEVVFKGDSTSDSIKEFSLFVQTFN